MANPQTENGFTKIANEVLEQLVNTPLLGAEFQVLLFIIRKTYGYNKKQDRISFTQFEKATGISRQTINKTIKNLVTKGMIVKIYLPEGNIGYTFIKDHEKWVVKTHLLVKGKWSTSKDVLTKTSKDVLTHKRKKEITKEITEQSSEEINLLIKTFEKINPASKNFYARNPQRNACKFLIETYGFDRVQNVVALVLPKTNTLQFFPTITTPIQLQDKWAMLDSHIKKYKEERLIKRKGVADINKKNDIQNYIG